MAHERLGSTAPPSRGAINLFRDLVAALRPTRTPSRESSEILDEHEEALKRLFPEGKPSGGGSEEFDHLMELRDADTKWQLTVRKWFQVAALIATFVSLAVGIAAVLNYLAA
jgi:alpha-ketoglutarate-dependent taurine dioxygenase